MSKSYHLGVSQYGDPVERIHTKFYRFLSENARRPATEMSVLCIPGCGASELDNVYRRLGCKERNITAVVPDRNAYRDARSKCEFRVVDADPLKYLGDTDETFDVVSLNFDTLTEYERNILAALGEKGMRDGEGVLAANFKGREKPESRPEDYGFSKSFNLGNFLAHLRQKGKVEKMFLDILKDGIDKVGVGGIPSCLKCISDYVNSDSYQKRLGDTEITTDILQSYLDHELVLSNSNLISRLLDLIPAESVTRAVRRGDETAYEQFAHDVVHSLPMEFLLGQKDKTQASTEREKKKLLEEFANSHALYRCLEMVGMVYGWDPSLTSLVYFYERDIPIATSIKPYSVTNSDGSQMCCDMFRIKNGRRCLSSVKDYYNGFFRTPVFWWLDANHRPTTNLFRMPEMAIRYVMEIGKIRKRIFPSFRDMLMVGEGRIDRTELNPALNMKHPESSSVVAVVKNKPGMKPRTNNWPYVMPKSRFDKLDSDVRQRITYFIEENLCELGEGKRMELFETINKSRWYRHIKRGEIPYYAFFDDLMLMARKGKKVTKDMARYLWINQVI